MPYRLDISPINILSRCGKESNLSIGILYLSLHEIQYRKLINVLYFFSWEPAQWTLNSHIECSTVNYTGIFAQSIVLKMNLITIFKLYFELPQSRAEQLVLDFSEFSEFSLKFRGIRTGILRIRNHSTNTTSLIKTNMFYLIRNGLDKQIL